MQSFTSIVVNPANPCPARIRRDKFHLGNAEFFFVGIKIRLILSPFLKHYKITTMNKAELIAKVADDAGVTKTQANAALDSFIEAVTKTLKGGGKVTLVGFGTFTVSKRKARKGRNPQTGEEINIKARKVARFKAGKELAAKL